MIVCRRVCVDMCLRGGVAYVFELCEKVLACKRAYMQAFLSSGVLACERACVRACGLA
jgi:hypothetical protein